MNVRFSLARKVIVTKRFPRRKFHTVKHPLIRLRFVRGCRTGRIRKPEIFTHSGPIGQKPASRIRTEFGVFGSDPGLVISSRQDEFLSIEKQLLNRVHLVNPVAGSARYAGYRNPPSVTVGGLCVPIETGISQSQIRRRSMAAGRHTNFVNEFGSSGE